MGLRKSHTVPARRSRSDVLFPKLQPGGRPLFRAQLDAVVVRHLCAGYVQVHAKPDAELRAAVGIRPRSDRKTQSACESCAGSRNREDGDDWKLSSGIEARFFAAAWIQLGS